MDLQTLDADVTTPEKVPDYESAAHEAETKEENNENEEISKPKQKEKKFSLASFKTIIGFILFCIVYLIPIMDNHPTEHTCLALVVLVMYLWISESVPAFVTAYIIPVLSVAFGIAVDPKTGFRYSAVELSKLFAYQFMDPVIFVFLGSLAMSTALAKLEITTRISLFILSHIKPTRRLVLLLLMAINVTFGSILTNIASTTLTMSLALPIMGTLEYNDPYNKALLLGIAWSGNCAAMSTVIASPQNIIAISAIEDAHEHVSFLQWLAFGAPITVISLFLYWGYLCLVFIRKSDNDEDPNDIKFDELKTSDPWCLKHTLASIVVALTIILWSVNSQINSIIGHTGITALIPIIWFFGSGVLTISDFDSFKWSTLALLGGGLALGEAMEISGLLDMIGNKVRPILHEMPIFAVIGCILVAVSMLGSVLSSTVAASVLCPLVLAIQEGHKHGALLACLTSIMISGGQLFHISSFPNTLASGIVDQTKDESRKTYLSGKDFIFYGWLTVVVGVIVISCVGYFVGREVNL